MKLISSQVKLFSILFIIFLAGCSNHLNNAKESEEDFSKKLEKHDNRATAEIVPLTIEAMSYIQTVGFVSNQEVMYIVNEEGEYKIYLYNLFSGKTKLIYSENEQVVQAFLHPSKKFVLLHCTKNEQIANVKIVSIDKGKLVENFEVPSKEIYVDWHPENESLVFISAFNDDFSYDSYVYDANENKLVKIDLPTPFVNWFDDEQLSYSIKSNSALQEMQLYRVKWQTGESELIEKNSVLVKKTSDRQLFLNAKPPFDHFQYVYMKDDRELYSIETGALSNYSEWYVPDIQFGSDDAFYTLVADEETVLDNYSGELTLKRFDQNGEKKLFSGPVYTTFAVSPNEQWILYNDSMSNLFHVESGKTMEWLKLQ